MIVYGQWQTYQTNNKKKEAERDILHFMRTYITCVAWLMFIVHYNSKTDSEIFRDSNNNDNNN